MIESVEKGGFGVHHLTDYIVVLEVLMNQKPMELSQIISKTGINSDTMKEYLILLLERHYVEERSLKNKSSYVITPRGISVVRYFEEIQKYPSLKIFENYLRTKE